MMDWYLDKNSPAFMDQVDDFEQLMAISARYGGTEKGGLNRITGTPEDQLMRDHFCDWLKAQGFEVHIDRVGNIFGAVVFDPDLAYILCGSHLDSQPYGGQFDGVYGVLAGAATLKQIKQAVRQSGIKPKFNLAVVCWTNEEGARFQPSLTGSSYFAGKATLENTWNIKDTDNISFKDALQSMGYLGESDFDQPVRGYLELHVEQGGLLEQHQKTIGIVQGIWVTLKLKVKFIGEQNHTGPAPMPIRKDALLAASHAILKVRHYADLYPGMVHSSVGKIENYPNSPNIVSETTTIYLEIRSADEALILEIEKNILADLSEISTITKTNHEIVSRHFRPGVNLDADVQQELLEIAAELGLSTLELKTIAGHDAISLAEKVQSNLIFIPSQSGLSHNEAEYSTLDDLSSGMQLLTHYLARKIGLETHVEGENPDVFLIDEMQ